MNLEKLDTVVRGALISKGFPIHYYLIFLHYAIKCMRELHFDAFQSVKTVNLPVDEWGRVDLPDSYVDWTKVGYQWGQYVKTMGRNEKINRLFNTQESSGPLTCDSTKVSCDDTLVRCDNVTNPYLEKIVYPATPSSEAGAYQFNGSYYYDAFYNDNGEPVGRWFGHNNSHFSNSFKVLREASQIQLDNAYTGSEIILEFISDGLECSEDTQCVLYVTPYAIDSIENYIMWKFIANNSSYNRFEERIARKEYYTSLRTLRSRLFGFTTQEVIRIIVGAYKQSIKI